MTRESLTERIRAALPADAPSREVSMFGGISFMVHDKTIVAARRDGDLLVHVDPSRSDELTGLPGARQAEMGRGRTMGRGWLSVGEEAVETDEQLSFWLGEALEYNDRAGRDTR